MVIRPLNEPVGGATPPESGGETFVVHFQTVEKICHWYPTRRKRVSPILTTPPVHSVTFTILVS